MSLFGSKQEGGAQRQVRWNLIDSARLEVIPLKNLDSQLQYLPEGSSVSVTASPAKTLEDTWILSRKLSERGFKPVPHLAARMLTSETRIVS